MSKRVWLEKAYVRDQLHRQAGPFSIGQGLISPRRGGNGSDIYRAMRELKEGDRVLHLIDSRAVVGTSEVAAMFQEVQRDWEPSYFVPLRGYEGLMPQLGLIDIFDVRFHGRLLNVARPGENVFFTRALRLRQGAYITAVPEELLKILSEAFSLLGGGSLLKLLNIDPSETIAAFQASRTS